MSSVNEGGLFTIGFLMPLLGTGALVGRLLARKRSGMGFEMDDYLCIPAWLMTVACGSIVMAGAGREVLGQSANGNSDGSRREKAQKAIGLATIKFSAIFLYRRLFPGRGFNLACSFVAGFVVQWFLTFVVSVIVFGVRRLEHPEQTPEEFTSDNSFVDGLLIVLSVENILVNVALFILPITVLSQLNLAFRRMLRIAAVFLFAAVAIMFGIMQLAMPLAQISPDATSLELITGIVGGDDVSALSVYMLWGILQLGCLLLTICLPTFGPIVRPQSQRAAQSSPVRNREPQQEMSGYRGHRNSPDDEAYPKTPLSGTFYPHPADTARQNRRPSNIDTTRTTESSHQRRPSAGLSSHPMPHSRNTSAVSANFRMSSASTQMHGRRPSEISSHIRQASLNGSGGTPTFPSAVHARHSSLGHGSRQTPTPTSYAPQGHGALSHMPQERQPSTHTRQGSGHIRNASSGSITGYRQAGHAPQHARNTSSNTISFPMMTPTVAARNPYGTSPSQGGSLSHGYHSRKGSSFSGHLRKLSLSGASPSPSDSLGAPLAAANVADHLDPREGSVSSHAAGAMDPTRTSWYEPQRSPMPVGAIKVKHGFTQSVEERDMGGYF